jgi:hypothetical protein
MKSNCPYCGEGFEWDRSKLLSEWPLMPADFVPLCPKCALALERDELPNFGLLLLRKGIKKEGHF